MSLMFNQPKKKKLLINVGTSSTEIKMSIFQVFLHLLTKIDYKKI